MKARKKAPVQAKPAPFATRWFAPDEKSFKRLVALGARQNHIYRGWKGEEPGRFQMRDGEYLGVVDGLLAFGPGRRRIDAAVKAVHEAGATVLDVETGRESRANGVQMLNEALDPPKPSKEYMAELARQRAVVARVAKGMMLERDAIVIWRNPKFSVPEALDLMHGWTRCTAYKVLGRRDVPAGRRPK